MRRALQNGNGALPRPIDGGDHMLPIEYPDATASAIASFLAHRRTGLKA